MSAITKPGIPKLIPSVARLSSHQDPLLSVPFSQKVWLYRDYFIFKFSIVTDPRLTVRPPTVVKPVFDVKPLL